MYPNLFLATSCNKSTGETGDVWYRHQGYCYTFVHDYSLPWHEAFNDCKKKGVRLIDEKMFDYFSDKLDSIF